MAEQVSSDQAKAEMEVKRLSKELEMLESLEQQRRESAVSRLTVVEGDYHIIRLLWGLMVIDFIVLLVGFMKGNLLTYAVISIGIDFILAIWFFWEKKKKRKKILDELNVEIRQIVIGAKATLGALQHNQRIVDTKDH